MLNSEEFLSTLNFLRQNVAQESCGVKDLVYYQLKWELKQKIGPKFNENLQRCTTCDKPLILEYFTRAVALLHAEISNFFNICEISNSRSNEQQRNYLDRSDILQFMNAVLFHRIDPIVFDVVKTVYKRTFSSYYQLQLRGTTDVASVSGDFSDQCYACEKSKIKCICWSMVEKFRQCNAQLLELDLLDRLAGDIVVQIAQSTIKEQVKTVCDSIYDVQHLVLLSRTLDLLKWLSTSILPWLAEVYCLNENSSKLDTQLQIPKQSVRQHSFDYQSRRLFYYLHDIYANYLIDRLFPIIIDFPETLPVVEDLKACMERVDLRQNLTLVVRRSLEKRLLHPGVNTADILTAYIQTVKTLRSIDPSGVLMDNVCAPIRQYLRSRCDTVRCIVSFITESRGLIDIGNPEIIRNNPEPKNESDSDDEDDVVEDWRKWNPEPWGVDVSCEHFFVDSLLKPWGLVALYI
uniref:Anaphase-promoting complex subunit 2 TPR repeats domain-containing protein n=1 Tax=Romanomermis culicivorax TaxID=13658 RepID=A0A915JKX8_ROMCU